MNTEPQSPARNIELKARLADVGAARAVAQRLATAYLGIEGQRDTYFACPRGRLKVREIDGRIAQLIAYDRADLPGAKASEYQIIELPDGRATRELLAAALGITVVVAKQREIFLYKNVRIHLDQVEQLGCFIEFEAVVAGANDDATARDDAAAHAQVEWLLQQFGTESGDLLPGSYSDMLERGGHSL